MTELAERIGRAQEQAAKVRPKVGGFPYLAQALRQAGVRTIYVTVPSMTTVYLTDDGAFLQQGSPQLTGASELQAFDEAALVAALRADQEGKSSYPEFMASAWRAGVLTYEVNLEARTCRYRSAYGESYVEEYASVELPETE